MFVRFVDKWPSDLALLTLIASSVIFCLHSSNSLDPDQDRQNVISPNRFDTMIVFLNHFFFKLILKKSADDHNVNIKI